MKKLLILCLLFNFVTASRGATFIVNMATSTGPGTLNQALLDANALIGPDTISFNLPGPLYNIISMAYFPNITDSLFMDGYSQPGSSPQNMVKLYRSNYPVASCFRIQSSHVTIKNIHFDGYNFGPAIDIYSLSSFSYYSNLVFTGNRFTDNDGGFLIFGQTTVADFMISNNIFEGNGYALKTLSNALFGFTFTNNLVSGEDCLYLDCSKVRRLTVDSNSITINRYAVYVDVIEASDFKVRDNIFSDSILINSIAILTRFETMSDMEIRRNLFDSISKPVFIYGGAPIGGFLNDIRITGNTMVQNSELAIDLNCYASTVWDTVIIHGNYLLSCEGSGINIGSQGTTGTEIMRNIRISNNVLNGSFLGFGLRVGQTSGGISTDTISDVSIYQNEVSEFYNGIEMKAYASNGILKDFLIRGNILHDNSMSGLHIYSAPLNGQAEAFLIDSNSIMNNGGSGIKLEVASNIPNHDFHEFTITNNVISDNQLYGIEASSSSSGRITGLTISKNSIVDNQAKGIHLFQTSSLYASPFIKAAILDSVYIDTFNSVIYGSIVSKPNTVYLIEYFSNDSVRIPGEEHGQTYLFSDTIVTDNSGYVAFSSGSGLNLAGTFITATVTDTLEAASSEFSNIAGQGVVGISHPVNENISVFPNPSNGLFFILFPRGNNDYLVEVFNSTGTKINNIRGAEIDLGCYPAGIYYIRYVDIYNILHTQKLVRL